MPNFKNSNATIWVTAVPDRSRLIEQKLLKNAKIEKIRLIFNFNYLCELRWFFAELVKVCHLDDDNACGWVSMVLMMQRRISVKGRAQLILERSDKDKKFMMCSTHLKRQKIWKMNHNCEIFSSLQILNSIDAKRFSENSWYEPTHHKS